MAELRDMVEIHIVQEAKHQKEHYDTRTQSREFCEGDAVWLQNPTVGKMHPKWEGGWVVKKVHSPATLQIEHRNSLRFIVVHINRIRHCIYITGGEHTVKRD